MKGIRIVTGAALLFAAACGGETGQHGQSGRQLAPGNDDIAGAEALACGATVVGSTVEATYDDAGFCGTSNTTSGVWYHFVGDGSQVTLSTCNAADYDTKISVFEGSPGALSCVAGQDDAPGCFGFTSQLTVCTTPGTDYYVLVHGFASSTGNFELSMSCSASAGGADNACDAQPLGVGTTAFSNQCATAEIGEVTPPPGTGPFGSCDSQDGWCDLGFAGEPGIQSSVWFQLDVPSTRAISIETTWGFDSQVAVWQASSCGDLTNGGATLVAANDDSGEVYASYIAPMYCLDPGATYYVQIDGFGGSRGSADIIVTELDRRIEICHNGKTRTVDSCALAEHLGHGDFIGACPPGCDPQAKVDVCHDPSGKNARTIQVSGCAVENHLAHGDFPGACGDGGTEECDPYTQLPTCTGGCISLEEAVAIFGDGTCDAELDCDMYLHDAFDCGGECPPSSIYDCWGGCYSLDEARNSIGNGICNPELDCEGFAFDGGDCGAPPPPPPGECNPGEIVDCWGGCVPEFWVGDGICDEMLNCPEYANDGGDCSGEPPPPGECAPGEVLDCWGGCVPEFWLGNGVCDPMLDCPEWGGDFGDCGEPPPPPPPGECNPGEIVDCWGGCVPEFWVGDGICDEMLNCAEWGNDGGDCSGEPPPPPPPGECNPGEIPDCWGGCVPEFLLGNGICDPELECPEWDFDFGDCGPL